MTRGNEIKIVATSVGLVVDEGPHGRNIVLLKPTHNWGCCDTSLPTRSVGDEAKRRCYTTKSMIRKEKLVTLNAPVDAGCNIGTQAIASNKVTHSKPPHWKCASRTRCWGAFRMTWSCPHNLWWHMGGGASKKKSTTALCGDLNFAALVLPCSAKWLQKVLLRAPLSFTERPVHTHKHTAILSLRPWRGRGLVNAALCWKGLDRFVTAQADSFMSGLQQQLEGSSRFFSYFPNGKRFIFCLSPCFSCFS